MDNLFSQTYIVVTDAYKIMPLTADKILYVLFCSSNFPHLAYLQRDRFPTMGAYKLHDLSGG